MIDINKFSTCLPGIDSVTQIDDKTFDGIISGGGVLAGAMRAAPWHSNDHMQIPGAEHAIVDIRKIRDYCLNPRHDEGKHKARLFAAVGIMVDDAEALRELLLQGVKVYDAHEGRRDAYGQRYNVDVPIE